MVTDLFGLRSPSTKVSSHRWILPTVAKDREVPWRKRLMAYGIDLDVAVTTENFGAVPFLLRGTGMVGVVQERLAALFDGAANVRIFEIPWEMRPLIFTMWWDNNHEHDPAHVWLRARVAQCLAGTGDGQPSPARDQVGRSSIVRH